MKLIKADPSLDHILTEEEAEAKLHKEGYVQVFKWHDVPGASYPRHRHECDECLWVLKGELIIATKDEEFHLLPGDRLYLPARKPHTAAVPEAHSVTYLVGQKEVVKTPPSEHSSS